MPSRRGGYDYKKDEKQTLIQRPTRTGFFQRIRNVFDLNKMMRLLIQLLVLINLLMFFSFIIGTAAVVFAVVMLDNFVYNQASGVPLRCYENLTLKQRFKAHPRHVQGQVQQESARSWDSTPKTRDE